MAFFHINFLFAMYIPTDILGMLSSHNNTETQCFVLFVFYVHVVSFRRGMISLTEGGRGERNSSPASEVLTAQHANGGLYEL